MRLVIVPDDAKIPGVIAGQKLEPGTTYLSVEAAWHRQDGSKVEGGLYSFEIKIKESKNDNTRAIPGADAG